MQRAIDPNSFGFLITDMARLIRAEFDRLVAESGLGVTPGEARVLAHAARAGSVRQNVLAERIGVEAMTVTGFVDRLEAKDLLRRRPDPADRRAKLVEPTEAAFELMFKLRQLTANTHALAASGVSERDWERFLTVLKAARDNLADSRVAAQSAA